MLALQRDWLDYLTQPFPTEQGVAFRRHERTGRPLGSEAFVGELERRTARSLRPPRPDPKPRGEAG